MGIGSYYIPLAMYLIGIVVVFLTIFIRTELGLLYLTFLIPLQNIKQRMHTFPLGQNVIDIVILALIIGWILRGKGKEGGIFEKTSANGAIFLYIGIMFLGLLLGSSYLGSDFLNLDDERVRDWKSLISLPILYFITVNNVKDLKWMKLILLTAMVSMFLTEFFFYREFRWYKTYNYSDDMRVSGAFSYLGPNELAAFFVQYGLVVLALFVFAVNNRERLLPGLLFLCTFYCLMYTFSRAGYLALPAGVAFILFFKNRKFFLALLVLLCLAPRFLPDSVMQRIEMTTLSEEEKSRVGGSGGRAREAGQEPMFESSAQGRLELWEEALKMFRSSPIFGTGYRTFSYLKKVDTHNNFAKFLAEMGVIGFSVYLLLYILAFRSGWQLYRRSRNPYLKGLGLGFSGCVIANIIMNLTHDNWSYLNVMGYYWVFWGLVESGRRISAGNGCGGAVKNIC